MLNNNNNSNNNNSNNNTTNTISRINPIEYNIYISTSGIRILLPTLPQEGTVAQGEYVIYRLAFPIDKQHVIISLTAHTGDADIYVSNTKEVSKETDHHLFYSSSFGSDVLFITAGNEDHLKMCNAEVLESDLECVYYVGVYGYRDCTYSIEAHAADGKPITILSNHSIEGELLAKMSAFYVYSIDSTEGVTISLTPLVGDPDLYIKILSNNIIENNGGVVSSIRDLPYDVYTYKSSHAVGIDKINLTNTQINEAYTNAGCNNDISSCSLYIEVFGYEYCRFSLSIEEGVDSSVVLNEGSPQWVRLRGDSPSSLTYDNISNKGDITIHLSLSLSTFDPSCHPDVNIKVPNVPNIYEFNYPASTDITFDLNDRQTGNVDIIIKNSITNPLESMECVVSVRLSSRKKSNDGVISNNDIEMNPLPIGRPVVGLLRLSDRSDKQSCIRYNFSIVDTTEVSTLFVNTISGVTKLYLNSGKKDPPSPTNFDVDLTERNDSLSVRQTLVTPHTTGSHDDSILVCPDVSSTNKCQVNLCVCGIDGVRSVTEFSVVVDSGADTPLTLTVGERIQVSSRQIVNGRRFVVHSCVHGNDLTASLEADAFTLASLDNISGMYWATNVDISDTLGQYTGKAELKVADGTQSLVLNIDAKNIPTSGVIFLYVKTNNQSSLSSYNIQITSSDVWNRLSDGDVSTRVYLKHDKMQYFIFESRTSSPHVVVEAIVPFESVGFTDNTHLQEDSGGLNLYVSSCNYITDRTLPGPSSSAFWSTPESVDSMYSVIGQLNSRGQVVAQLANTFPDEEAIPCYYRISIVSPRDLRVDIRAHATSDQYPTSIVLGTPVSGSVSVSAPMELYRVVAPSSVHEIVIEFEACIGGAYAVYGTSQSEVGGGDKNEKDPKSLYVQRPISQRLPVAEAQLLAVRHLMGLLTSACYFLTVYDADTYECYQSGYSAPLTKRRNDEGNVVLGWIPLKTVPAATTQEMQGTQDNVKINQGVCLRTDMIRLGKPVTEEVVYEVFWMELFGIHTVNKGMELIKNDWASSCGVYHTAAESDIFSGFLHQPMSKVSKPMGVGPYIHTQRFKSR
eukprot:GHVR01115849.1.p1 GENE.GHVR01115849.1~~GHVR01115849.1.p1  ORF type:complete len:1126 (+),score=303.35 GHVR01115849.1:156-3380(+)